MSAPSFAFERDVSLCTERTQRVSSRTRRPRAAGFAVDLVVSCSRREGMPLNIIEAMLCAKPVVVSHNRGHDELVSPGRTGILLSPTDADGFAAAIDALAADAGKRYEMGEAALRRIQPYAVSNTREELYGLLRSLTQ